MRVLVISRGGMELARAHINRPVATIGRSPTCDVVLRAPGVAPIHFLLEWVGAGTFDPNSGDWTIFDVSQSADDSGEGVMISAKRADFAGFHFVWVDDKLEINPEIGGSIQAALTSHAGSYHKDKQKILLELVQIRADSGAVEEVLHLPPQSLKRKMRPIRRFPQFQLGAMTEPATAIRILLEEMPGAEVLKRGAPASDSVTHEVSGAEILEVRWKDHRFFIRFVSDVEAPKAKRVFFRDVLLLRLALGGLVMGVIFLGIIPLIFKAPEEQPQEPPRIATIQIREIEPPPPPPPPPVPEKPKQAEKAPEKKIEEPKVAAPEPQKPPAVAAAPKFKTPPGPPKEGLNVPAPPADVNTLGVLGALKSAAPKGPGIRADRIVNQGLITESVSGAEAQISINNPAMGIVGTGKSGSPKRSDSALAGASTTIRGAKNLAPGSVGPIAMEGGKAGYQVGFGKGDLSTPSGGASFGSLDVGSFEVAGGLDRETVRRVIAAHRNQIRACYERALLSDPKLGGRVVYRWDISPAGPVNAVAITKSDVGSKSLESCVHGVIKNMIFPAAPNKKPTTVIYPFVFQAKS